MSEERAAEKSLFLSAIGLGTPKQRAEFLDEACGDNPELRQEVQALLDAHERLRSLDVDSPADELETDPHVGSVIDCYKLLERIGEGGMAVVFLAEQTQPIARKVALKIIKPGMASRQVIARFEAERQALAVMDHPNIAKVLDAGTTDNDRPYFVMELVKGVPITRYCDENRLAPRDRLELFVQVCQAVQHAHQKGIIHRDIKPTNVLVSLYDGKPVPKVIDFGVAKAMGQQLTERTMFTGFGAIVGTLEYMSPEQAQLNQLDIDTRSDIYSLGVLLYELLTGTTPLEHDRLKRAALDEVLRTIRQEEPPKPSTRLSTMSYAALPSVAAQRGLDPQRLAKLVHGELDWIAMKALEKDRTRRYETASALASDLDRYLSDRPVEACPPSRAYRLKKFIRRNKAGVFASAAVAAALAAGLAASSIGFMQARRQAAIARVQADRADREAKKSGIEAARSNEVSRFLQEMLAAAGPSVARGRDATLLREILDKTAKRVESDLKDQPEVQGDLWFTLGNTCRDIGDYPRAIRMLDHAVQSYRSAFGNENTKLALALGYLGKAQSQNYDIVVGHANAKLGVEVARKVGDSETLATCLHNAATSLDVTFSSEGLPLVREAVELRQKLGDSDANRVALANCMRTLAALLGRHDRAESEKLMREALAIHTRYLGPHHFSIASAWHGLGWQYMERRQFDEAQAAFREEVDQFEKLDAEDHWGWLVAQRHLLTALGCQGKWDEAESIARDRVSKHPSHAGGWFNLGSLYAYRRRWQDAVQPLSRAEELTRGKHEIMYDQSVVRLSIALLRAGRAQEYRDLRRKYFDLGERTYNFETGIDVPLALWLLPAEGTELAELCRFADLARDAQAYRRNAHWVDVLKALTEYRRGDFAAANELTRHIVSRKDDWNQRVAQGWFLHSLTCARLQQMEAAREAFANGDKLVNQSDRDHKEDILWAWPAWSEAEMFRAEAAELLGITGSRTEPDEVRQG